MNSLLGEKKRNNYFYNIGGPLHPQPNVNQNIQRELHVYLTWADSFLTVTP